MYNNKVLNLLQVESIYLSLFQAILSNGSDRDKQLSYKNEQYLNINTIVNNYLKNFLIDANIDD